MLDLLFTKKEPEHSPTIKYLSPNGKSDHVMLDVVLQDWEVLPCKEDYENRRLNHAKTYFTGLRKFFGSIDWKRLMEGKTVQENYETFLKYNEDVQKYVPVYKVRRSKHIWHNTRCAEAKKRKDIAWKKLKKQRN